VKQHYSICGPANRPFHSIGSSAQ